MALPVVLERPRPRIGGKGRRVVDEEGSPSLAGRVSRKPGRRVGHTKVAQRATRGRSHLRPDGPVRERREKKEVSRPVPQVEPPTREGRRAERDQGSTVSWVRALVATSVARSRVLVRRETKTVGPEPSLRSSRPVRASAPPGSEGTSTRPTGGAALVRQRSFLRVFPCRRKVLVLP